MADQKITELTGYTPPIPTDVMPIVDITNTATKKITIANISAYLAALAETLTNKTLTTPTIGSFTNATHNHTNAAGGGQITQAALSDATATATASKIPIADGSGKLDTWVSDASDTAKGKVELAIASEVTTGTDATRAVTPDALAGSSIFGVRAVQIQIVADGTDVDTTSGIGYIKIPAALNGMNLIRAQGFVTTAGSTNATTIQVRNLTQFASNDALSSAISIASGGTVGTAGTVDTSYDAVATNDNVKVYVTGQSTTKPKGLYVVLEYQLP